MRNAHVFAHKAVGDVLFRFKLFVLIYHKHLYAGIDQESAKDVQDPIVPGDKGGADGDEDSAEYNGHQDADEQYPCIAGFLYFEEAEDEDKYEDIIDGERPFHEVGAQVADGG